MLLWLPGHTDHLVLILLLLSSGASEFFQNKLVDTVQFMEVLSLKDSVEKDSFFRKFPALSEQLPRPILLKKVRRKALDKGSLIKALSDGVCTDFAPIATVCLAACRCCHSSARLLSLVQHQLRASSAY